MHVLHKSDRFVLQGLDKLFTLMNYMYMYVYLMTKANYMYFTGKMHLPSKHMVQVIFCYIHITLYMQNT